MDEEDDGGERRHDPGQGARVPAAAAAREARIFPVKSFRLGQDARLFCAACVLIVCN